MDQDDKKELWIYGVTQLLEFELNSDTDAMKSTLKTCLTNWILEIQKFHPNALFL